MARQQSDIPYRRRKLDGTAQIEMFTYKQEVDEMFNSTT